MPLNEDHNVSPFNNLPPVAVVAALAMVAIEVVMTLAAMGYVGGPAGVGWRNEAVSRWGIWEPAMAPLIATGQWSLSLLARFLTYPFLHGSFSHMLFGVVILLALSKFVGEVFSGVGLVLCWLIASIAGAVAFLLLSSTTGALYGAMPGDYGLVGALTFILWQRARQSGGNPWGAFRMIAFLLALQVMFGALAGGGWSQILAELAGFVAGFLSSFVLGPGGWTQVQAALRRR